MAPAIASQTSDAAPVPSDCPAVGIICPSWVGDVVMASGVYRALRGALPSARITALVRPGLEALLAGAPWFDEVIGMRMKGLTGPLQSGRAIRGAVAGSGAVLLLPNSFRSALGARLGGAPIRAGYARDGRRWLLTHALDVVKHRTPNSTVDYYARLGAWAIGAAQIDPHLELFVTGSERAAADQMLSDLDGGSPLVVLNPGANRSDKRWPADRFAAAGDALSADGCSIAVTGGPAESDVVDDVCRAMKSPAVDLVKRGITLGSLKGVLARASLLVTNDTGPRHVAAALGTRVVTLFGPTDHRWTTLPGTVCERIILSEPFLPEELVADACARLCRMEHIPVSDVVAAARDLLSETLPQRDVNAIEGALA